jgi:cold shock CspA family protein
METPLELEQYYDRITSCRVVVEKEHRRHQKGNLYRVSVDLLVPGKELVVSRKGPKNHAHEDVYVAIRDAFGAATRQLEDYVRSRQGKVKSHDVPLHGEVTMLNKDEGFGFVTTGQGEVYFHRNSVLDGGFESLELGSEVRLEVAERESGEGWQATTVRPIGKHHVQERVEKSTP